LLNGLDASERSQLISLGSSNSIRTDQLNQVPVVIAITLVVLATVNAIFVSWATALDARHSSALTRTLGATPQRASVGLSAAQVLRARRRDPGHPARHRADQRGRP
jgi:putative ABC transport system permease protein